MSAPAAPAPVTSSAWEWRATGTVWRIHHDGCVDAALARAVAAAVERDEARWSRFRETSEVARISAAAGDWVDVTASTLELLGACVAWRERTGGVFDPLVGAALSAWGYAEGWQERTPHASASPAPRPLRGALELDGAGGGRARIPAGTRLDLGGIGKGWIADRVAALLRGVCPEGRVLVDAGGDLAAACGTHLVAVQGEPSTWIPLDEGEAVATSGWGGRRWRNGDGREAHHLIDPATGAPGGQTTATAVAACAADADVLAKTIALRPERLTCHAAPARVHVDGEWRTTAAWDEIALVAPAPRFSRRP